MSVFERYAEHYDLTYADKDYDGESRFVHRLIQEHKPRAKSILDLGCGTGRHDFILAEMGYNVLGVDVSSDMIRVAQKRKAQLHSSLQKRIDFVVGDIRQVDVDFKFDVVLSLFHVLSYQTTDEDIQRALNTAANHLVPGGVCLIDFWFGPAVVRNPPKGRIKQASHGLMRLVRKTETRLCSDENMVDVRFEFEVGTSEKPNAQVFSETHRMRYFFLPEMRDFLKEAGLAFCKSGEWLTDDAPGENSWSVYILAQVPRS